MNEPISNLSERELAELCALADGTLPEERRAAVEARVAASPELQELLELQRLSLTATRALADEPVPESVRAAVEARRVQRRTWVAPRLAAAGALAAVLAVVAAVALTGGPAGPTVAEAAALAARPPSATAPPPADEPATLAAGVDGVAFPDFLQAFGWRAVGLRHDRVDGRNATVVYYERDGRRIGYVIVAGAGLNRPSAAQAETRGGVEYQTLRVNGRPAVTWRRDGRTCILIGPASRDELLALASY
jgi:anti-sigma factor RsiW